MPPDGYPAFLQYLQSGRVRKIKADSGAIDYITKESVSVDAFSLSTSFQEKMY